MLKSLIKIFIIVASVCGFRFIPMEYHIPITDVNSEAYYVWLSWFVDHIADENDTLNFEIASRGGSVFHGYRLVASILETDAHTVAKVKSGALSMGAVIMVICDEVQASNYSLVMFHKASTGGRKVDLSIVDNLIKDYAFKYFTQEERLKYILGQDVWIDGKEFERRFNHEKVN